MGSGGKYSLDIEATVRVEVGKILPTFASQPHFDRLTTPPEIANLL